MKVHTDDEVYRVDAVWLGPPKATFPWRARYVAWGIGLMVFFVVFATARKVLHLDLGIFMVTWCVIITIALTRWIGSKISNERPFGAVLSLWQAELDAPRPKRSTRFGAVGFERVHIREHRPRPAERDA